MWKNEEIKRGQMHSDLNAVVFNILTIFSLYPSSFHRIFSSFFFQWKTFFSRVLSTMENMFPCSSAETAYRREELMRGSLLGRFYEYIFM